ncbi:hypothetical protein A2W54_02815 [Candidatus Giovannonibacteria bacterium RIFCSPHIGHO2_02_43_13]|uniref:Uncharacterized protein n=1 Tax=Candidatus Giovannonibacteria bacterium RIFCSPHIGHO2_02_43_13 TaxID=1798330 RepID=A0A1F5WPU6_9BACT|nr:MAG: hypothetical protein A3E06_04130 [Candidatus Giovannonibacteria bacterium RIFCSPHIGHO2_12_FULL_44_42]OGF77675.1 MAG: hypothetical protein A2W54_02815 [Candidatus Giovannonibacteria bacterium RIFCSPHIGHO2_02_43_13]OGF88979.1 MAG: hypothetical protein A3I94_03675 [Candidatus Giovannonibacteria bacterium RIFCSPLOWO2_02_FULL_43_54]OGF97415.1 MAG: hypothetical protein A3H08_04025 [Candidatus Giovannonibacteria bacterium RIFCSPLOWO2_12_FULL_44_32]
MDEITKRMSGSICGHCGGRADDWKCPKCGKSLKQFDPFHWKNCTKGGKMKAQCNACAEAEDNCKCAK